MEDNEERLIGIFIGAGVESAPQLPFYIKHKNGESHRIISQLHSLFVFPFASGKSVLAEKVPNSKLSLSHTEPAIVGTISKDGDIVKSDLINAANRVYCMDEAHRLNKKAMDAMLSLLESGYYNRSLGYAMKTPVKQGDYKKAGWEVSTEESLNSVALKVRFSCIGFCERVTKGMEGAFLSRFAIFNVVLTDDDIFNLMRGEGILKAGNVKSKYKIYKKPVIFDCYDDFVDEYQKLIMEKKLNLIFPSFEKGYLARIGAHLAKLSVYFARIDYKNVAKKVSEEIKVEKKHYQKALLFAPLLVRNLKEISLTPEMYKIYDLYFLRKIKQVDVSNSLGVSKSHVSQSIKFLTAQGFIELTKEQTEEDNIILKELKLDKNE